MFNKLKQFKDLRDQAKKLQDALSGEKVTVNGLGGKISISMDGNLSLTDVNIDPEYLDPSKKEKVESTLKDLHRDALKQMQTKMAMKMKEMGGLPNIPGLN